MPIVANYAERPFEFPQRAGDGPAVGTNSLIVPWRTNEKEPSRIRVSEEQLKAMQEHHVARGWFGPGQLAVEAEPADREAREKIPTAAAAPRLQKKDAKAS